MADTRPQLHILLLAPGAHPSALIERTLLRMRGDARLPHEIHIVAARPLLADVTRELLAGGRFGEMCRRHGLDRDEILFNARTLHPVVTPSALDWSHGADRLLGLFRTLTASIEAALTVVIADDAGVTGYLVQACLPIVARVEDRLVLDVSLRAGHSRSAACGYLELPLLLLPPDEPVPATYAEAAVRRRTELRRLARPDVMRMDVRGRTVRVGETSIVLPAMQFFWLWYLASAPGERFPLPELASALSGPRRQPVQVTQTLSDGRVRVLPSDLQRAYAEFFPMAPDKFEPMFLRACGPHPGLPSTISKINAALRRALGLGAGPYLIQGGRGAGGYRITLPAASVQIVGRS